MGRLPRITRRVLDAMFVLYVVGVVALLAVVVLVPSLQPSTPTSKMSFSAPIRFYPTIVDSVDSQTLGDGRIGAWRGEIEFRAHPRIAMWIVILKDLIVLVPAGFLLFLLRKVAAAIDSGEPFADKVPGQVRLLGIGILAYYGLGALFGVALWAFLRTDAVTSELSLYPGGVDYFGLFVGIAVVVLAEVFRQGATMRAESELTV